MVSFDPKSHHRRSIRLKGYDYTQAGAYFVTICTWQHACSFGEIVDGVIRLTAEGRIASEQWVRLERRFPRADFSAFVIMPNHVHGIVVLTDEGRGAGVESGNVGNGKPPLRPYNGPRVVPGSLGAIVRAYKAAVAFRIHAIGTNKVMPVWQRNYYEHIIRDEADWLLIMEYIEHNPQSWEEDRLNLALACKKQK
jgi:putative transposase